MKKPVCVFEDLPNHYAQTNVALSPDEELIFTGTSVEKMVQPVVYCVSLTAKS